MEAPRPDAALVPIRATLKMVERDRRNKAPFVAYGNSRQERASPRIPAIVNQIQAEQVPEVTIAFCIIKIDACDETGAIPAADTVTMTLNGRILAGKLLFLLAMPARRIKIAAKQVSSVSILGNHHASRVGNPDRADFRRSVDGSNRLHRRSSLLLLCLLQRSAWYWSLVLNFSRHGEPRRRLKPFIWTAITFSQTLRQPRLATGGEFNGTSE